MRFARNLWVTCALALSDFISFALSLYIAIGILELTLNHYDVQVPENQIEGWIALHWLLACCMVIWCGVRLRHYFYRKTFWFELKEILRTLLIFAIVEIAVIAFAKWYFSRYLWVLTWALVLLLVPTARMLTKVVLDKLGIWQRDTMIIGSGKNAVEAYKAISDETNMGLRVIGFISDKPSELPDDRLEGLPVIHSNAKWLENGIDKRMQFIVAVENDEGEIRNSWLRELMIKGYRYVSVIPTLRGMPLDSTDMSFIFSHEVMIFRVHQNLAKWSSRISCPRLCFILAAR
jgi:FlaA1/EpsC-like NDP-sugar epimerase